VVDQHLAVLGVDQVELAVAVLDPVVADDQPGRAVLEVVAAAAGAQPAHAVELVGDVDRRGVGVVLVVAALDAVVVDEVALDQDVLGGAVEGADEQPVAGVVKDASCG